MKIWINAARSYAPLRTNKSTRYINDFKKLDPNTLIVTKEELRKAFEEHNVLDIDTKDTVGFYDMEDDQFYYIDLNQLEALINLYSDYFASYSDWYYAFKDGMKASSGGIQLIDSGHVELDPYYDRDEIIRIFEDEGLRVPEDFL